MQKNVQDSGRITISLPANLTQDIENIRKELGVSRSEMVRIMIERYIQGLRQEALRQAATIMEDDYATDAELTAFTTLDGEDFR
jgi:metal-responsive CopG/Arc/MetJ family transcriptional regulator